jgi:peptidoglycan/xylan/chitin deacetylase (PgdA/CDA1 family)
VPLRIPVLTYHAIAEERSPLAVTPRRFAATMHALRESGWRTLTIEQLLQGLAAGEWPPRSFVLHFDDGLASIAEHGVPILQEHGFHATMFIVTGRVGRWNDWPGQPASVPRWPLLDWPALRELARLGMAIGAHSISHPHLPRLSRVEQEREVIESLRAVEDGLGAPVHSFAYPYGESTPVVEAAVAGHCRAGFGTALDFVGMQSRVTLLERIDGYYLRPDSAARMDQRWFDRYLGIRRAGRALKRRFTISRIVC